MEEEGVYQYLRWYKDVLLMGTGSAVAKCCTAPIERIQIILQTQYGNTTIRSGEVRPYEGIIDCLKRVRAEQGFSSLWRGNLVNVIRFYPHLLVEHPLRDAIKDNIFQLVKLNDEKSKLSRSEAIFIRTTASVIGIAASLSVLYPFEFIHTRLAADVGPKRRFHGIIDCVRKTFNGPNGVMGLYKGFFARLLPTMSHRTSFFMTFDQINSFNPFRRDQGFLGQISRFSIANTVSIILGLAIYPFGTVSRRLQMQSDLSIGETIYKGTVDCVLKIFKEEGILGFFRGAGAIVIRNFATATTFTIYYDIRRIILVDEEDF